MLRGFFLSEFKDYPGSAWSHRAAHRSPPIACAPRQRPAPAERGLHIDDASEGEKYFCVSPAGRHGPRVLLGEQSAAIYQYNHSIHYVLAVAKIASTIEDSPIDWS